MKKHLELCSECGHTKWSHKDLGCIGSPYCPCKVFKKPKQKLFQKK